ncbi:MAG: polysaccharide deacetylase family protein, partial [Acidobacteriota bacterium]
MSVLAWHEISTVESRTAVSPARFRAQMNLIGRLGLVVGSLEEARRHAGSVALTFDDGHEDTYTAAYPVLAERGWTATLYVATRFVSTAGWFQPGGRAIGWSMLRELKESGWCIGSHSASHLPLVGLADGDLEEELGASRRALEDALGCPCIHFCAPYGDMDDRVLRAVRGCGYETAALSVPPRYPLRDDSRVIYRSGVYRHTSGWLFRW